MQPPAHPDGPDNADGSRTAVDIDEMTQRGQGASPLFGKLRRRRPGNVWFTEIHDSPPAACNPEA